MRREFARVATSALGSRWLGVLWYLPAFTSALAIVVYLLLWWFDACVLVRRFGHDLMTLYAVGCYVLLGFIPLRVLRAVVTKRLPWLLVDGVLVVTVFGLILVLMVVVPLGFCSGSGD